MILSCTAVLPSSGHLSPTTCSPTYARPTIPWNVMDMDMSPRRPHNYPLNCEPKSDKKWAQEVDRNECQLSLRTCSFRAGAKDKLCAVETETMDWEDCPLTVTLAALKMPARPMVSRGALIWCLLWSAGWSGGQGMCMLVAARSSRGGRGGVRRWRRGGREAIKYIRKLICPRGGGKVPQDKAKLGAAEDDEDEDDDFDEEETEQKPPVNKSIRDTPGKKRQKSNQNEKDSKPSTPRSKSPEPFKEQEKQKPPKTSQNT